MNKNAAINFWTSMSIGSNICITYVTFAYASSWKTFAKQDIFICTIIWLHLHLHIHVGANPYIISTYICICIRMKDICITRFSFAPSQGCDHVCISNKDFASSIAGAYHFEDLTYVSALGYPFLSIRGFNLCCGIRLSFLSFQGFNLWNHIRLPSFILSRF